MKVLVYDGMDNDGRVSSFLIKRASKNIELEIPLSRNRTIMSAPIWEDGVDMKMPINLGDLHGKDVIFTDIMLDVEVMDYIAKNALNLNVFDHHEFVERAWLRHGGKEKCATKLVWEFLYGDESNELVEYVNDRDLFFKKLPDSDAVFLALQKATDEEIEWALENGVSRLIERGKELHREHMERVNAVKVDVREWRGFKIGYTQDLDFGIISDVGAKACRDMDIDFYVNRNRLEDGMYSYSLRSIKGNILEICKEFGGGGHPSGNAGGFQTKKVVF